LTIQKAKIGKLATSPETGEGQQQHPAAVASPNPLAIKMSRNRPRGPPVPRDNGLAANEETDMWNKILQDLRKAKEKNDKQKSLAEQISALNEKIGKDGGSK
jgi:SAGA-associated factor 29